MSNDPQLNEAQLVAMYRNAMSDEAASNWVRGDIAIEIQARAEQAGSKTIVKDFLDKTGENRVSFNTRCRISKTFASDNPARQLGLDWTMFRLAAGTDEPDKWLQKAHDNSWSCRQMNEALDGVKAAKVVSDGAPCACGCTIVLPEDPIFVGGIKKKRFYFATILCAIKFLNAEMMAGTIPAAANTAPKSSLLAAIAADVAAVSAHTPPAASPSNILDTSVAPFAVLNEAPTDDDILIEDVLLSL